jgi:transposase
MGEELRDDHWALIEPLLPAPKRRGRRRADDRRTLNDILLRQAQDRSGSLDREPAGRTYHQSMAADLLVTAVSRDGRSRGSGSRFGLSSWVPWTSEASWTGARPSWTAALSPLKKGRGYSLWLERQGQHRAHADRGQWLAPGISGDRG